VIPDSSTTHFLGCVSTVYNVSNTLTITSFIASYGLICFKNNVAPGFDRSSSLIDNLGIIHPVGSGFGGAR